MHVTNDEMKCENVKWKMWWYEEDIECIMKLPTSLFEDEIGVKLIIIIIIKRIQGIYVSLFWHTMENINDQIIMSGADERVKDGMNYEWHKHARSKFQEVSPE